MRVLGVDACKLGWVGVVLADGGFAGAQVASTLAELIGSVPDAEVAGVDMPMGLVERGWRAADNAAVAVLGPRRSSLFRVPPRQVWDEVDFAAANARCRDLTGAGLSQQAWGLRTKLREADECRRLHRLVEVHPEVSFRHLAGAPVRFPKMSWNGQELRRTLLRAQASGYPTTWATPAAPPPTTCWTRRWPPGARTASPPEPPSATRTRRSAPMPATRSRSGPSRPVTAAPAGPGRRRPAPPGRPRPPRAAGPARRRTPRR